MEFRGWIVEFRSLVGKIGSVHLFEVGDAGAAAVDCWVERDGIFGVGTHAEARLCGCSMVSVLICGVEGCK